jgi:hypothetical protein
MFLFYRIFKVGDIISRMVAMLFSQDFFYSARMSRYMNYLTLFVNLLMVSFVVRLVLVNFTTDLVKYKSSPEIKSIEDVIERDLKPIFLNYNPIFDEFRSSNIPVYKQLWSKCLEDERKCIQEVNEKSISETVMTFPKGTHVVFIRDIFCKFTMKNLCLMYGEAKSIDFDTKFTKPIMSKMAGYIYNKKLTKKKVEFLHKA